MITGFRLSIYSYLLISLMLGVATSAAAANYKCWTNEDGVRECGHSVPPEYSQQRIEVLNDRGIVVEVEEPAKTDEQIEAEKRAAEELKQQEQREAEKRRRDRMLLNTFTTERDLQLFYQDKLSAIQSQIDLSQASNTSLKNHLDEMQKRAANLERRGETVPDNLLEDMEDTKRQMANNDRVIAEKKQEMEALNQKFEAELQRFRELKSARAN